MAHPLRLRILRLCGEYELTNKQLAERLEQDPGTMHYHVRQLVQAELLEPAPVRSGNSGALEKPYRSTERTWQLNNPLAGADEQGQLAPVEAFQDELRAAGPGALREFERFALHLSAEQAAELDLRIHAIINEYLETDHERLDQPLHGGLFALHLLAQEPR
ncbi:helix-turn-helix protein [Tamaricihabitans halophyticus]|uniref:Helix-turn-helix protein n=1 Tax=Tamaricihabitans halophyticus TaxID=1262583 RepID=A0A4R2R3G9_9PSEU|nr:helix-turn-helix protein [Tamaricihabitans halophyticus]